MPQDVQCARPTKPDLLYPQTVSTLGQPRNEANPGHSAKNGLDRLGSELQLFEKQLSAASIPASTRQLADCSDCSDYS